MFFSNVLVRALRTEHFHRTVIYGESIVCAYLLLDICLNVQSDWLFSCVKPPSSPNSSLLTSVSVTDEISWNRVNFMILKIKPMNIFLYLQKAGYCIAKAVPYVLMMTYEVTEGVMKTCIDIWPMNETTLHHHHHHHHHHVPEELGVLSCSLILKMKLVPPPLPWSFRVPSSFWSICNACFGNHTSLL